MNLDRDSLARILKRADQTPRMRWRTPDRALRPAAVLVPLLQGESGYRVLLTRRSDHLRDHAGQVSFPGGRIEAGDGSPEAAALREAEEEVGLLPANVDVVGALPPLQTGTGFMIHPVVGLVREAFVARPEPGEVAETFEVPLAFFLDPANHKPHIYEHGGRSYRLHAMPYEDYYIWGATAAILRELYELVRDYGVPEGTAAGLHDGR